ncbi:hypothetical protein JHK82_011971 [Glycine max]|uniref:Uncharacterized protein n=1 Tax=Glycine max TaxID=3847 RepID=A0A0R0JRG3_SOYBN|nr:hypothetical protein JHK85_012295 [Glycine max]KAG5056971.1 hypothetical protein JHK86_011967 [Glycine max]KAG5154002.1 hypothetical protein JHK82_011971 [Glycine max]KAH1133081.1 hypothetical protein GYH30_011766 [Glycine max]KRH57482.1 hypothetical protein GLYMA_05G063400v4 [Glycine max]
MFPKGNVKKLSITSPKSFAALIKKTSFLSLLTISFKVTCCSVSVAAMVQSNQQAYERVNFFC